MAQGQAASPADKTKKRKRQYAPKTRTGCRTCRIRRVKCDEARPHCHKCKSTGRSCDGYETIRMAQTSTDSAGEMVLRWVDPPAQIPALDLREQESLYHFRDALLDSSSSTWDMELFERLVMPMSVNEPIVRHAIVALGALSRPGNSCNTYGLKQYGLAMKSLQEEIANQEEPDKHLTLVACLLFVAIEFVQQQCQQAHFHLNGGLSIVKEIQEQPGRARRALSSKSDIVALEELFGRLDNQMSLFTSTRVQLHRAMGNGRMSFLPAELRLTAVEDAAKCQKLQIAAMRELVVEIDNQRFTETGISASDYVQLEIQQGRQLVSLERWHTAMQALMDSLNKARDIRLGKLLLISYICCKIMVTSALSDGREVEYDRFLPDFERVLAIATELAPISMGQKSFSLDTGMLAPTYYVVLKCRDPVLRRRAIALLKSLNLQEGVWESSKLAILAERLVRVEEQGLSDLESAADVPERSRLWRAYFDIVAGDDVLYCMRRAWEGDGSWMEYEQYVG